MGNIKGNVVNERSIGDKFYRARYASLTRRFIATAVDSVIIGGASYLLFRVVRYLLVSLDLYKYIPQGLFSLGVDLLIFAVCGTVVWILYGALLIGIYAKTIGQGIMGVKVLTVDDKPLTLRRAFARSITYVVIHLPGALMFVSIANVLCTARKQAAHDLICRTVVVKE